MLFQTLKSAALLAALPLTYAQTFTDCNPLQKTCPADKGLAQASYTADFTSQDFTNWQLSDNSITKGANGAEFKITADGQAPTMTSDFYIFFGRIDVTMKAAPGVGIVSAVVLESDDLDEIDWEWLGGDTVQAQSNFFGKGDTTSYARGAYHPVSAPQSNFHTYSIDWNTDRIQWLIDGAVVRELPYSTALTEGGNKYPQTPARVKIGNWVAGGANNAPGTVQWAGGKTDFSQAPFVMYVKSVSVTNANPAASYTYGDQSGSWQSIQKSGTISGGSSVSSTAPIVSSTTVVFSSSSTSTSTIQSFITTSSSSSAQQSIATLSSTAVVVPNKPISNSPSLSYSSTTIIAVPTSVSGAAVTMTAQSASSGFQSSSRTSSSTSSTTYAPIQQTGNSAATVGISTAGSLLSLAAAFFLF